jgi:hypothetical protein
MMLDARHNAGGMPAGVAGNDREPAAALDQRGEIGFAIFQPEDQEVAFAIPEAAAILAGVALPSGSPSHGQMTPKFLAAPFRPVDELIDGFVADGVPKAAMASKVSRNLLLLPDCRQAVSDIGGKFGLSGDLAATHRAAVRHRLCGGRKIATIQRLVIEMPVTFELAIDGRMRLLQRR